MTATAHNSLRTDKLARMCRANGRLYYVSMLTFYARGNLARAFQLEETMHKERAYVELQDNPIRVYADEHDIAIVSMLP